MAPTKRERGRIPKSSTGGSRPSPATQNVAAAPANSPSAAAPATPTSPSIVASCEAPRLSARMITTERVGIPWWISRMRENLNQALCRAGKDAKTTAAWRAANATGKAAIVQAARSRKEQQERAAGFHWRDAATSMGFRAKGQDFDWKGGSPKYHAAGSSDSEEEEDEDEDEEELPFSLPDNEPTMGGRREEDDDEDDPMGEFTAHYVQNSAPRQVV
ncbi:hypothetical protein EYC84_000784 [Monilinia fructicola]|uniref:Uncharacterized protein n=1 Tax=Monilinia fructicola TaxID=38448 RepID=A0A5M9JI34_MONFR|nr:hypothetical protein EYC84_000784 [Monilinia fructicola]